LTASRRIYGVVILVPPHLSRLADRVRRIYDPNFPLIKPHVTVLPPRPLALTRRQVTAAVRRAADASPAFLLGLGGVRSFRPVMPVAYAGIRSGGAGLKRLHRILARPPLRGRESFPYVPHMTLGQNLEEGRLREALLLSRRVFAAPAARRPWLADSLVIVERRSDRLWVSLPPVALGDAGSSRSGGRIRRR